MHYFSDLFDKVLYVFRTGPLPIIRSISTLYTGNGYLSCQFCWRLLAQSGWNWSFILTTLADANITNMTNTYCVCTRYQMICARYSVEILLMMDTGPVRNMQSTLSNKSEKQCISLAFIMRIYHDARSSEFQIHICFHFSLARTDVRLCQFRMLLLMLL